MKDILVRYNAIKEAIAKQANFANRDAGDITLVAVSKFFDADSILSILHLGHRVFAENRVQEAAAKWPALRQQFPAIELHLIGPLQTNKIKQAIEIFDVIESLDRESLAIKLAKQLNEAEKQAMPLFIQVNSGEEEQKAGIHPPHLHEFARFCCEDLSLNIKGLMCIPPQRDEAGLHFAYLAKQASRLNLPYLSMGMSSDFETAIQLGATHIRLGTAIFGERASA